jgi:transposase-like protein
MLYAHKTVTELANSVIPNLITKWKKQALEDLLKSFRQPHPRKRLDTEKDELVQAKWPAAALSTKPRGFREGAATHFPAGGPHICARRAC